MTLFHTKKMNIYLKFWNKILAIIPMQTFCELK